MKSKRWVPYVIGGGVLAVLVSGWSYRSTQEMSKASAPKPPAYDAAILDGGSVISAGKGTAPNFTLLNQNGKPVSLQSFRGKVVVLTFLDPVCYDTCPTITQQFAKADSMLGARAKDVEMVGVVANPLIHTVSAVQSFNQEHGLNQMTNWNYLTSPDLTSLQQVWHKYHIFVNVPGQGRMVMHTQGVYFISPDGKEMYFDGDSGNAHLTDSYAALITHYVTQLLPQNG